MKRNAVISVMVEMALLLSLGVWVKDASADAILFPWVVRSDDVTTVVSVVNTAETDAEAMGLPFHNNRIHIEYWHKKTTANDQEELCTEYNFEITSSKDDMVTWDMAGHFNSGLPMFNDTSNEVIAVPDMTLAVENPRRAFLIVDNNTQAIVDSGTNVDGTMYGEATIIEHKTGAAWGYIAYNARGGQKDPIGDTNDLDLDFSDSRDQQGEVLNDNETTQTTLMNPNDATTKLFITPADDDDDHNEEYDPDCDHCNDWPDRDQRRGNANVAVQLCRFPEIEEENGSDPYTGDCNSGGIWNNEEGGFSFTVKKNVVCTTADNIVDFFGGAGSAAYQQWVASGKAGWAYIVTQTGSLDEKNGIPDGEDGRYVESDEVIIGKLEYGTTLNWSGSIADTINNFVWLRDNTSIFEESIEDGPKGINIIHNEYAGQIGACCLQLSPYCEETTYAECTGYTWFRGENCLGPCE
jgi:hypothetical protein